MIRRYVDVFMLRRKLLKLLIIILCITIPYYYAKNRGYFKKLDKLISVHFGDFALVKKVEIKGNSLLSTDDILKIVDIKREDKLYRHSAQKIKDELLKRREIRDVNVQISYSGIIRIIVDEKKPFAIWWNDNISWLVDKDGDEILKIKDVQQYNNLIIIFGKNIKGKLKSFLDVIRVYPLYNNITTMHYVGNRRWDVYLHNDVIVKLPEKNVVAALGNAEKVLKSLKYQNKIDILDLRLYPKRVFLKLRKGV